MTFTVTLPSFDAIVDLLVRASGFSAFVLAWLAVVAGAAITGKAGRRAVPAAVALELHRQASLFALVTAAVHGLVLAAVRGRAPLPGTAAALDAGWLSLALMATAAGAFWLRSLLGPRAWRTLHVLAWVGFVAGLVHGVVAGTDTGSLAARGLYLASVGTVVFAAAWRALTVRPALPR